MSLTARRRSPIHSIPFSVAQPLKRGSNKLLLYYTRRVMKAVYFYMDTVVAVKSLWNGKRFVTAKWDGKRWRILTYKSMPSVASREKAEENLQR